MQETELQALLKKLRTNTISDDERARLNDLLNQKQGVSEFIREADNVYLTLKANQHNLTDDGGSARLRKRLKDTIGFSEPETRRVNNRRIVTIAAATIAVSCLIAAALFVFRFSVERDTEWITVKTDEGQYKEVLLKDGTVIKVSGSSILRYPKSAMPHMRLIQFDGEGFFKVAKDAKRPFIVVSGAFSTRVLGTSFTIDSDIDQTISVIEGKVEVIGMSAEAALKTLLKNDETPAQPTSLGTQKRCVLSRGQQAQWNNDAWMMTEHDHSEWRPQDLICTNEPLKQILKKYTRIYGQKVTVDPTLAEKRLTISLTHGKPEKIIETLALVMNAKFIKHPDSWELKK